MTAVPWSSASIPIAVIDATLDDVPRVDGLGHSSIYETALGNLPLIGHVCEEIAASGVEKAHIVTQPSTRRELGRILGGGATWGLEISYVDTADQTGRGAVLGELHRSLHEQAVLLHPGDCLLRDQLSAMARRYAAGDVDSVLPEQASVDPLRSPADRRASPTALVLGPHTRPLVQDLLSPESEGEDLIAALLASEYRLAVCSQTETWCYSETTEALLSANRMVLDGIDGDAEHPSLLETNRLHGRLAIGAGAFVSNCDIYGPVSIADRAVVEDSFIGPYTSIATDAVVSGAEIDNSMVLAGAEVRHPGFRIEGSIIGERSRITRSFELPKGLHLRLGADSQITIS